VLSVDEKSQIQTLDRTQPGLPMKKGRRQTITHDYKRNGTTTLLLQCYKMASRAGSACYAESRELTEMERHVLKTAKTLTTIAMSRPGFSFVTL